MPEPVISEKAEVPDVKVKKLDKLVKDFQKLNVNEKKTKGKTEDPAIPKLTPYQGKSRAFGWFRCTKCKKDWTSAVTWANTHQKCKTCALEIYPYRQRKLEKGEDLKVDRPPHQKSLCGKCRALGHNCTPSRYNR